MTFRFPRDPITLDDKEVEFVTKLCGRPTLPPILIPQNPQLNLGAVPQRGAGATPDFPINNQGQAAGQLPECNYNVKKKFKLKDMVVNGELTL